MLEGRHYQNAYVTRDLGGAVAAFTAAADIRSSMTIEATAEVLTPAGRRSQMLKMAFIWVGDDARAVGPARRTVTGPLTVRR